MAQDAHRSRGKGAGSGLGVGQGARVAGADCRVSLTLGWPGPSSGYQGQGKPSRHRLGWGRRAQLQGRRGPLLRSSPLGCLHWQVSSTGNGGTKAFCKARARERMQILGDRMSGGEMRAAVTCSPLADHRPPAQPRKGRGHTYLGAGWWFCQTSAWHHPPKTELPWRTHQTQGLHHNPGARALTPTPLLPSPGFILSLLPGWGQHSICNPTGCHSTPVQPPDSPAT